MEDVKGRLSLAIGEIFESLVLFASLPSSILNAIKRGFESVCFSLTYFRDCFQCSDLALFFAFCYSCFRDGCK